MSNKELNILINKKIFFNYFIEKKIVAGIVLNGWEVKSIRNKNFQISSSYAIIKLKEVYLINMIVNSIYKKKDDPDISRSRKLLLNKSEIRKIIEIKQKNKLSIVPLRCFLKNHLVKIELALVKGKKNYDKRSILKDQDWKKKSSIIVKNINSKK